MATIPAGPVTNQPFLIYPVRQETCRLHSGIKQVDNDPALDSAVENGLDQ